MKRLTKGKGETGAVVGEERSFELERIVFFSDAVIAIAITLLALEITPPERPEHAVASDSFSYIAPMWSHVGYYALSFVVIGIYWMAHHRVFRYIRRYDYLLLWLNLLFLLSIAFVPVPTKLLSEYGDLPVGPVVYAATLALTGLFLSLLWWYATHDQRLVSADLDSRTVRLLLWRSLGSAGIFLLSIPVALFINPTLGEVCWLLVAVLTFVVNARLRIFDRTD